MTDNQTITNNAIEALKSMHNKELLAFSGKVYNDLVLASESQPNSEWHESCFAAFYICSEELNARGLKLDVK